MFLFESALNEDSGDAILPMCPSGGTGRRAGLKIRWPQGRDGSTPFSGTKIFWKITYGFGTVRPSDSNPPYKYPVFMLLRKIAVSYVANSHCYQLLPITAKIRYRMTHVDTSA